MLFQANQRRLVGVHRCDGRGEIASTALGAVRSFIIQSNAAYVSTITIKNPTDATNRRHPPLDLLPIHTLASEPPSPRSSLRSIHPRLRRSRSFCVLERRDRSRCVTFPSLAPTSLTAASRRQAQSRPDIPRPAAVLFYSIQRRLLGSCDLASSTRQELHRVLARLTKVRLFAAPASLADPIAAESFSLFSPSPACAGLSLASRASSLSHPNTDLTQLP